MFETFRQLNSHEVRAISRQPLRSCRVQYRPPLETYRSPQIRGLQADATMRQRSHVTTLTRARAEAAERLFSSFVMA